MRAQRRVVAIVDLPASLRDLEREGEHCLLSWGDVGFPVVDADLIGNERLLRVDAQDGTMRDEAVEAVVGAGHGHDDHLALGLGEARIAQHQRVVVGEEGAKLVRTVGECQEDVGDEPGFFLHFEHSRANVVGQVFELRHRVAAYGMRGHTGESSSHG